MLKEDAAAFMELGKLLLNVSGLYGWDAYHIRDEKEGTRRLNTEGEMAIRDALRKVIDLAYRLKLPISKAVLERHLTHVNSTPQSLDEYRKIVDIFEDELREQVFLFLPQHIRTYYEWDGIVSDEVLDAFPKASDEIRVAGNCLATGNYTAAVFHAMRAAEIGLRALASASSLVLKGSKPIEMAEWREILDALSSLVLAIENRPNTDPTKDDDLLFYSEAAAQFRFFKGGWRIRVMHARATYNENQAIEALNHVRSFFEILAKRLKEP